MNCKNCGYGLKQSCGDFEKILCTYEEGECVKITELETTNKRISDECHKLVDTLEKKQKEVAEFEAQLTIKIINCIKSHLCKQDEDYDKPIISPKFLSDTLDQMVIDGFEGEIKENEYR